MQSKPTTFSGKGVKVFQYYFLKKYVRIESIRKVS